MQRSGCVSVCLPPIVWMGYAAITGNSSRYTSSHNAQAARLDTSEIPATLRSSDALVGIKTIFCGILGHYHVSRAPAKQYAEPNIEIFQFQSTWRWVALSPLNIWCNWDINDGNKSRVNAPNRLFCMLKPKQVPHVSVKQTSDFSVWWNLKISQNSCPTMRCRLIHFPRCLCSAKPRPARLIRIPNWNGEKSISSFDSIFNEMGTIVNGECESMVCRSSGPNIYEWINWNMRSDQWSQ